MATGSVKIITNIAQKRAVGYFRVSSPKQTGERHSSLPEQESQVRAYCHQNSLSLIATFCDVDTGRKDNREQYQRMLDCVKTEEPDEVVIHFLDRFGRNPREILRRYWDLEEHGVKVVATGEDIKEEVVLLIKAWAAGNESRRTSERVRSYMPKAIGKGVHVGRPPYGLRPVKEIKGDKVTVSWELDTEEAPIVKEMYHLSVDENLGFQAIANRLTGKGYRAKGGRPFASFTVQAILTNPALKGTLVWGRKPKKGNPPSEIVELPDFFPAILSSEEWLRLQSRLAIRLENPKGQAHASIYLLSGIARCGNCGGPMAGKVGSLYKGKRYRNYYCGRAMHGKGLCDTYNGHSAPKLERAVLEYLGQFTDPEKVKELLASNEKSGLERDEKDQQFIEKRLTELDNQFIRDMDRLDRQVINEEEFARINQSRRLETETLKERQAELKIKIEAERKKTNQIERVPQAVSSFLEDFQEMDIRQQKAQLQTILKSAIVHKDGRVELEFRE